MSLFVRLALEAIRDRFLQSVSNKDIKWKDSTAAKYLLSKEYSSKISSTRAVPERFSFAPDEKDLLDRIILSPEQSISTATIPDDLKATADNLIKQGLIFDNGKAYTISAPVIQTLLIRRLHGLDQPLVGVTTLDEFILETIKRFSPQTLSNSFSVGKDNCLLERQWQMEFYRAATTVLGQQHLISPDYANDDDNIGYIDFYVDDNLEWGIELLREGYKIAEHAQRFDEGGPYADMDVNDCVILDFRSESKIPRPNTYTGKVPIWYIMYSADYKQVRIKRKDKEDLTFVIADVNRV